MITASKNRKEILTIFASLPDDELYELYRHYSNRVADSASEPSSTDEEHPVHRIGNTGQKNTVEATRICPLCNREAIVKYGHKDGKQRYKCKSCGKIIVRTTNSVMSWSHQPSETWKAIIRDTLDGATLDESADELDVSHGCAFNMRHKVLKAIEDIAEEFPVTLGEVSELDETYVLESMKGTKGCNGLRNPRKRGGKAQKRGLSDEQICICSGIQRDGPAILKTVNRAHPSKEELNEVFAGDIDENAMVVTDGAPAYRSLQNTLGCKVVNAKKQNDRFYHLNNVNSLHSFFKTRYRNYRGVATKYLNRYNAMISRYFRSANDFVDFLYNKICNTGTHSYVHTQEDIRVNGLLAI